MSDHTLTVVSSISKIIKTGSNTPMRYVGVPMMARRLVVKKKHPIGTPALPIATSVAVAMQTIYCHHSMGFTKTSVIKVVARKIKIPQPFMLMVAQTGMVNLEIKGFIFNFSHTFKEDGMAMFEDFVKNATLNAGKLAFMVSVALIPFFLRSKGRKIKA